jgi:hypothetical protein
MADSMTLALVASGSAIIGSVVTGWFTYIAAAKQREIAQYKRRLRRADKNIAAFHRLEEKYSQALHSENKCKSPMAWKRAVRKQQRDEGFDTPSDDATVRKSERRISDLT